MLVTVTEIMTAYFGYDYKGRPRMATNLVVPESYKSKHQPYGRFNTKPRYLDKRVYNTGQMAFWPVNFSTQTAKMIGNFLQYIGIWRRIDAGKC